MDLVVQRLESRLHEKIAEYFPELRGENLRLSFTALKRATYSTVYFFRSKSMSATQIPVGVVVKVYSKQQNWDELSKAQYSVLRAMWPLFENSRAFGLPRPLDFFPDPPALVMEEVRGESLQRMFRSIWRFPIRFNDIVRACWGCGQWLYHFHNKTRLPPHALDLAEKRVGAHENLARLEAFDFSKELLRKVETSLTQKVLALTQVDLPKALVHGDFTVDNVLIDQKRTCVIDLTGRDQNAIYHDLATFLNSLRMLRLSLPIPTSFIRSCSKAFLSGYFTGGNYNPTALEFIRLAGLISVISEILNRRGDNPLARWWIRRFFAGELRSLVDGRNDL